MSQARCGIYLLGFLSLSLAGCRGDVEQGGARRYEVEGTVTYEGTPIPSGEISFEPDTTQGNSGPAAVGVIEKGAYQISREKGPVAGPLKVHIIGRDGIAEGTMTHGKALFAPRWEQVTQPEEKAVHNFDLSAKDSKK